MSDLADTSPPQALVYPATFRDRHGEERTTITNDGRTLTMVIRGVEFSSQWSDDWTPSPATPEVQLTAFDLRAGELVGYTIQCRMPVPVVRDETQIAALLDIEVSLGEPDERGRFDQETVALALSVDGATFRSNGEFGFFEDALLSLHRALPEGMYLKSCFTCAFSDYRPGGNGMFGCMACYRDNKEGYRAAGRGKSGIFRIWHTMTGWVQETWLCPEFERRQPNTGYRG
jgi:hypothetical protein